MTKQSEPVALTRDCEAVAIPSGQRITLKAGDIVTVLQSLGGDYTVSTFSGLARVAGKDADALGKEVVASADATSAEVKGPEDVEKLVWEQLRTVYDPEIPVNVVELGLIYECHVTPVSDNAYKVDIKFTLTAPGCGMGDVLRMDIERKILGVSGVKEANVEVVLEPFWNPSMMSEAARLELGFF
jgi:probable FeS assembly SUF system protein SufT